LNILEKQGEKKEKIQEIKTNRLKLDDYIASEEYYLTNLDIWAIATKMNLPIVLFSKNKISNLGVGVKWIILGGNSDVDSYYFIRSSDEFGILPQYHIIDPVYKLTDLKSISNMIKNPDYFENNMTFENYLVSYKETIKNK
jgi:hypothetical protein